MNIAIIGSGVSGMVTAYLLHRAHQITLFEAEDRFGGHVNTCDVTKNGSSYAVDTGFIVFNEVTYPNFTRLLRQLQVPWQASDMSFGLSCDRTGLEYAATSVNTLFAQRRNLMRPAYWRMIADIFRFRRESAELLAPGNEAITLGDYLKRHGYARMFTEYFIIPMGAAIWSASPRDFLDFPAAMFVRFFTNHGFLKVVGQPRWLVVQGGSNRYAERLTAGFRDRIRCSTPIRSISRFPDHVLVQPVSGPAERFDQVVIACHSDQALALLADPAPAEQEILGAIPYQENLTLLHTDENLLPRNRRARASWNYHIPADDQQRVALTYSMNRLQSLAAPVEFCVTLNRSDTVDPNLVLKRILYQHPVYTTAGVLAQQRRAQISGINRTWYCGAYWGNGFHEDGVNSALAVAAGFGETL